MRRRFIVHVDIDAFFAAVEVLLNPSLEGQPVIVGGLPHERGVVSTASYEARRFGVHSGLPLRKAYQLCPQGIFLRGNYQLYRAFSEKFFSLLSSFTPDVEAASLDEAYLDLTRCRPLYPSFSRTVRQLKEKVEKELGLRVSVGVGPNKLLAKLATHQAKPGGLVEIPPGKESVFLQQLPVGCLPGVGPKAQAMLNLLGVKRVGDLWSFPRSTLRSLFGLNGDELYLQVRGIDARAVEPVRAPQSFSRETTFLEDIWDEQLLLAHLAYLSDRLALTLREEKLFAHLIEVKIRYADFRTVSRRRRLTMPLQTMGEIYRVAQDLFLSLFDSPRLALRLVGVKAAELTASRPLALFEPFLEREERLSRAVAEVRRKYGFAAVLTVRERLLERCYPLEQRRGFVLKTASLTK
ncbi:MAG: DNA polymerase IV [Candidatus Aminicenantes bacterium]|nr:MAG: DNA polymerase IV [Candidatus Aminicenantes bacterium]